MNSLSKSARFGSICLASLVTFSGCGRVARQDSQPRVIYGDDNRKDIFEFTNNEQMKVLAASTAALIDSSALKRDSDEFLRMQTTPYGESMGLCRAEPYYNQPTGPWCSGFLVAPNVLVTAGHCVRSQEACAGTSFVFGFGYTEAGTDLTKISAKNVYTCKKLVKQELNGSRDFAVVQLDRPVEDRKPLEVRREGEITTTEEVTVIGHPSGLPTKISDHGAVRSIANPDYIVTNLDTYGGNSGSAVFNSATGKVEGILVRGERDFVTTADGCRVSNVCAADACRGEDVSRAAQFVPFIPATADTPLQ